MGKIFTIAAMVAAMLAGTAEAKSARSSGYVTKKGTYVAPSYKTTPNKSKIDNYSSKPNVNPYTGKSGTVDPYKP